MARRSNDPIKTDARRAKAQRRVGHGAACVRCGESDPLALVAGTNPKLCQECYNTMLGKKRTESHHIAGKPNSRVTVELPANDHRAKLSEAQYEWPPQTLRNADGSPLLAAAAALRGIADFIEELIVAFIRQCAELAEKADAWLREQHGLWWKNGPLDGWQPG